MSLRISSWVGILTALPLAASGIPERPSWDAQLRTSSDEPVALSRWRGRPTVVFYEDKGSTEQNVALKRELFARARAHRLFGRAHVLGVANLHGLDFFPANLFALSAVRDAERKDSVPVLVDWNRALSSPPWNLPPAASSVVLLDADGQLVHSWSGPLGSRDIEEFFSELSQLLKVEIGPAS
ncbi:MAG TPA: hypothetical protein VLT82_22670 [Myxococcaceae bacterium]|nr:hypothetical protein [Myxococcaceae bacterium]